MMRKYFISGLLVGLLAAAVVICFVTGNRSVTPARADDSAANIPAWMPNISKVELPTELRLFGKQVPLNHWEVRERFEREFYYNFVNADQLVLWTKRLRRWEGMIDSALRANGLSTDFKYLMVAESGVRNVQSPAKAHGFWQFIPPTAERYGLRVDNYVDERLDPRLATAAAMRYLSKLKNQFNGDELLMAASYNMGEDGLALAVDNQKRSNFWDLYLNDETMRYPMRIAVIKELIENDQKYGLNFNGLPAYAPLNMKTVTATGPIDVADWAIAQGYTYKDVKMYNQWIVNKTLPAGTYQIALPVNDRDRTTIP